MKDRVSLYPGRVLITPEDGSTPYHATLTRADEPTQEGTPLNKASLLKDTTAALYGKDGTAVPDDIFQFLGNRLTGELYASYTVQSSDETSIYIDMPTAELLNKHVVVVFEIAEDLQSYGAYRFSLSFKTPAPEGPPYLSLSGSIAQFDNTEWTYSTYTNTTLTGGTIQIITNATPDKRTIAHLLLFTEDQMVATIFHSFGSIYRRTFGRGGYSSSLNSPFWNVEQICLQVAKTSSGTTTGMPAGSKVLVYRFG